MSPLRAAILAGAVAFVLFVALVLIRAAGSAAFYLDESGALVVAFGALFLLQGLKPLFFRRRR